MPELTFPLNIEALVYGFFLLIVLAIGLFLYLFRNRLFKGKAYPIHVEIIEERSGNKVLSFDRARRVEEREEGMVIELKNRKKKIPPIPLKYLLIDKNGKSHLKLYTPDNERFFPVTFSGESNEPEFLEEKAWDIVDYRTGLKLRELFKTQSFMEKYGNILFFLIFGFLTLVGMYFVFTKLGEVVTATANLVEVSNKNLESTKLLIQSLAGRGVIENATFTVQPPY